ncbi:hypothetical protein DRN69_00605 [Candidatus Pacearchaeota archaeon]|nr:MAG: hypothetical protein DRN69_00605 [Candidatus Pacearchaeota archaeon]
MKTRTVKNWNELVRFVEQTNLNEDTVILSGFLVNTKTKKINRLIFSKVSKLACKLIDDDE